MRDWQLAGGTWKGNGEETKHHAQSHVNCTGTIHIVPWWRWGELTRDFGADHYAKTSPSLVHRFRYYGGALNHYTFTCLHSLLGPNQRCASLRKAQHLLKVDESIDARNEIYPWLHNPLACAGDITRCWSPSTSSLSQLSFNVASEWKMTMRHTGSPNWPWVLLEWPHIGLTRRPLISAWGKYTSEMPCLPIEKDNNRRE